MSSPPSRSKGFTLIELLVVIGVIGVLAAGLLYVINPFAQFARGRDTQRKSDLHNIQILLEAYFNDHQRYPASPAGCGAPNPYNCYFSSYPANTAWIPDLVPAYTQRLPVDPVNNAADPYNDPHLSYAYGNVPADGQSYDLFTRLENQNDPQRCGVKDYQYGGGLGTPPLWPQHWCTTFGGVYSDQIYAVDQVMHN